MEFNRIRSKRKDRIISLRTIMEDFYVHGARYEWLDRETIHYRRITAANASGPFDHRRIKIPLTLSNDRNEISARAETRHLFPSTGDR